MYANRRHYILFILALIALAVSILGFVFLRQQIYHQAVLSADLIKQVASMEEEEKHERDINNVYAKLNAEKVVLKNAVVTKEGVVDFIEIFEKIGTDTG